MDIAKNSNFQNLNAPSSNKLLPANKHLVPEQFKEVARGMEKQFADFMVEQMMKTVGSETGSQAESYYRSLMNSEQSDALTKNSGGLGIQDLILDEIYPRKFRNEAALAAYNQQMNKNRRNPIEMTSKGTQVKETGDE